MSFKEKLAINIKDDIKSFYAYARSKTKGKVKVGPLKSSIGETITDNDEICEAFNTFFASVFTSQDVSNIPQVEQVYKGALSGRLSDVHLDLDMVKAKLMTLRADKAPGADDLHPRYLKEVQGQISEQLMRIWQQSMNEGSVPDDWRAANVTPIYKKGCRSDAGNYRPVSLTSQVCKLFESIVRDQLVTHLESNKLITDSQHGFRRGRSCLTNILAYLDQATRWADEGVALDTVYLDFAKAFDKVPHQRLLNKIEGHGVTGKLLKWIGEWLRG